MIELKQYEGMINKRSWACARKYGLDFEDVQSQAFLVFCEVVGKYDDRRASFSTYLWTQLWAVDSWCWGETRSRTFALSIEAMTEGAANSQEVSESMVESWKAAPQRYDLLAAKERPTLDTEGLSPDAKALVLRIVRGDFYNPERRTHRAGSATVARAETNWNTKRFEAAWNEARNWWRDFNTNPV